MIYPEPQESLFQWVPLYYWFSKNQRESLNQYDGIEVTDDSLVLVWADSERSSRMIMLQLAPRGWGGGVSLREAIGMRSRGMFKDGVTTVIGTPVQVTYRSRNQSNRVKVAGFQFYGEARTFLDMSALWIVETISLRGPTEDFVAMATELPILATPQE